MSKRILKVIDQSKCNDQACHFCKSKVSVKYMANGLDVGLDEDIDILLCNKCALFAIAAASSKEKHDDSTD